jgi:D-aminoacyl-tRNA deacylase
MSTTNLKSRPDSTAFFVIDQRRRIFQDERPRSLKTNDGCKESKIMRAVIQRVSRASVTIDNQIRGSISAGLVVLLGIEPADSLEDAAWLAGKIVRLRIFNDERQVMNRSVQEIQGDVLLISQFTLFASTKKGNRPSYSRAARPETAVPLYEAFIRQLTTELGKPIQTGEFGADMKIELVNDGPVTILIDSQSPE